MIRLRGKLSTSHDYNSTKQLTTTTKNNDKHNNNYSYIVDGKNSRTGNGSRNLKYNNEDTNAKRIKNNKLNIVSICYQTVLFNSKNYKNRPLLLLLSLLLLVYCCIFSVTILESYFPISILSTLLSSLYISVTWIFNYSNKKFDTTTISQIEFCTKHVSSSKTTETPPTPTTNLFTIDNYCSKHNINKQRIMTSKENQQEDDTQDDDDEDIDNIDNEPTILIIGGTDGSGTRAITNVLRDYLGTNILYEDPITLDIHAPILFHHTGWPSLVNYILNYTHTGSYDYTNLSQSMQQVLHYEMYNFKNYYERRSISELYKRQHNTYVRSSLSYYTTINNKSTNTTSNSNSATSISSSTNNTNTTIPSEHGGTIRNGHRNNQNHRHHHHHYKREWIIPSNYKSNAIHVLYGFKAPVSMMLLPLFVQLYGGTTASSTKRNNKKKKNKKTKRRKIKFIHVIRDGRDIALSKNKAPVEKFYNTYYGNSKQQQRRTELYMQYNTIYLRSLINTNTTTNTTTPPQFLKNSNTTTTSTLVMDNITFVNTILAIDLWNDWNKDVYNYCMTHTNDIDYIIVRTEDLVSTNVSINYSTITKLAYFVGTTQLTNTNICQYSKDQILSTKDLGVSSTTYTGKKEQSPTQQQQEQAETRILSKSERRRMEQDTTIQKQLTTDLHFHNNGFGLRKKKSQKVMNDNTTNLGQQQQQQQQQQQHDPVVPIHQRYGKWKSTLQNQSLLSQLLHTHGHDALQLFGYEPYRMIESDIYYSDSYNVCF